MKKECRCIKCSRNLTPSDTLPSKLCENRSNLLCSSINCSAKRFRSNLNSHDEPNKSIKTIEIAVRKSKPGSSGAQCSIRKSVNNSSDFKYPKTSTPLSTSCGICNDSKFREDLQRIQERILSDNSSKLTRNTNNISRQCELQEKRLSELENQLKTLQVLKNSDSAKKVICNIKCEQQEKRLSDLEKRIKNIIDLIGKSQSQIISSQIRRPSATNSLSPKSSQNSENAAKPTLPRKIDTRGSSENKSDCKIQSKPQRPQPLKDSDVLNKQPSNVNNPLNGSSHVSQKLPTDIPKNRKSCCKCKDESVETQAVSYSENYAQYDVSGYCDENCPEVSCQNSDDDQFPASDCECRGTNAKKDKLILEVIECTKDILSQIVDGNKRCDPQVCDLSLLHCKDDDCTLKLSDKSTELTQENFNHQSTTAELPENDSSNPNSSESKKMVEVEINANVVTNHQECQCDSTQKVEMSVGTNESEESPKCKNPKSCQAMNEISNYFPNTNYERLEAYPYCGKQKSKDDSLDKCAARCPSPERKALNPCWLPNKILCSKFPGTNAELTKFLCEPCQDTREVTACPEVCPNATENFGQATNNSCDGSLTCLNTVEKNNSRTMDIVKYTKDLINEINAQISTDLTNRAIKSSIRCKRSLSTASKNVVFKQTKIDDCNQTEIYEKNTAEFFSIESTQLNQISAPALKNRNLEECQKLLSRCSKECKCLKEMFENEMNDKTLRKGTEICNNSECPSVDTKNVVTDCNDSKNFPEITQETEVITNNPIGALSKKYCCSKSNFEQGESIVTCKVDVNKDVISNEIIYLQQVAKDNRNKRCSALNLEAQCDCDEVSFKTSFNLCEPSSPSPNTHQNAINKQPELGPISDEMDSEITLVPSNYEVSNDCSKFNYENRAKCQENCYGVKQPNANNVGLRSALESTAIILQKTQERCEKLQMINSFLENYAPYGQNSTNDQSAKTNQETFSNDPPVKCLPAINNKEMLYQERFASKPQNFTENNNKAFEKETDARTNQLEPISEEMTKRVLNRAPSLYTNVKSITLKVPKVPSNRDNGLKMGVESVDKSAQRPLREPNGCQEIPQKDVNDSIKPVMPGPKERTNKSKVNVSFLPENAKEETSGSDESSSSSISSRDRCYCNYGVSCVKQLQKSLQKLEREIKEIQYEKLRKELTKTAAEATVCGTAKRVELESAPNYYEEKCITRTANTIENSKREIRTVKFSKSSVAPTKHFDPAKAFQTLHLTVPFIDQSPVVLSNEDVSEEKLQLRKNKKLLENNPAQNPHCFVVDGKWSIDNKIYKFGERGSGFRANTAEVQDFYKLRDENLQRGTLFEDREFPANNSSLYFSHTPDRYYEWKRPMEICDNPQLFVEGYSRFDVQQGELGDCWLLAAVANLTLYRRLFFQIVPDDQGFEENYAGIFHFRFWQYGRWVDVVIDDRLPTYRGQLVFLHSTEENEFWSALLEKAYAKLHGSYEALKGGSTCEAMEDFTGGVTEMYELEQPPPNLFKILVKAFERSSLMGCSMEPDPNVLEAETGEGLIRGHAYSITKVKYVDIQTPNTTGKIPLLRLRNPWGNENEWNGPWSDKSPEWRFIPDHEKEDMGLNFDEDGEFWMSFQDFQKHFDRLEICNLNPESLTAEEIREGHKKQWEVSFFEGEWVRGVTAGGCRNYLETFWHNPQYRVTLTDVDDDDDEGKCTIIVALMQKHRRARKNVGVDVLTIGFAIYHLPYPDRVPKPLDLKFFKYNASVARSPSFINLREVSCRFKLPPGTYCIVPSTFDPNEEGEFLLRVFSEHKNNMEENDEQIGFGESNLKTFHATQAPKPLHSGSSRKPEDAEKQEANDSTVLDLFKRLAGDDEEVDWQELKEVLDYAFRNALELPIDQTKVIGVETSPVAQTEGGENNNRLLMQLLDLLCGNLCKNTPLADLVPSPTDVPEVNSYHELRDKGFSKDVCRSMVAMLDVDKSGKLGFDEFKRLWADVKKWHEVFAAFDADKSGSLSGFELRSALNSAGYTLNNHILNILAHRYGNKNGEMAFEDFIMCSIKLRTMIDMFKQREDNENQRASFSLEEWIENTLYS